MTHIVEADEIRTLGRPIGKVTAEKLEAFITEAEQLFIKPVLGEELYYAILSDDAAESETIQTLLDGGQYTDARGVLHGFVGLKVAVSYYVYAQNIMSGDIESTRFGMVMKNGEYSSRVSGKERSDAYNNALEVAKAYLQECVGYCLSAGLIKRAGKSKYAVGGITIRRIGR